MKTARLEQIADIQYGYPFDSKLFREQGRIRIIRIRDIKKPDEPTFFDGEYSEEYVVKNGDILIGMDGEFNCTIWKWGQAVLNQRLAKIAPNESVSKVYLYYFLKIRLKEIEQSITASTVKHLLNSHLRNIVVPLLPLEEQAKMASMLEKADELGQKREEAKQITNKILQAFFLQLFGNPVKNTKKWKSMKLFQVGTLARGKSKHRPRNSPELLGGKYPLVQTGDVANCGGYVTEYSQTYSEIGLKQSKMWSKGTLCITIAANIAATGILTFDACFPDSVVGFTPNENVTTEYVQYWLSFIQKALEATAPQAAQKNINLKILSNLDIPTPPIELQNRFSSIVTEVEQLQEKQKQSTQEIINLFDSLMSRAFKGELVTEVHARAQSIEQSHPKSPVDFTK